MFVFGFITGTLFWVGFAADFDFIVISEFSSERSSLWTDSSFEGWNWTCPLSGWAWICGGYGIWWDGGRGWPLGITIFAGGGGPIFEMGWCNCSWSRGAVDAPLFMQLESEYCILWVVISSILVLRQRSCIGSPSSPNGWEPFVWTSIHLSLEVGRSKSSIAKLNYAIGPIWALRKVFLRRSSSLSRKQLSSATSVHFDVFGPTPALTNRLSKAESWWMKVALISKSGRLELRNSSVLSSDQRYLRIK